MLNTAGMTDEMWLVLDLLIRARQQGVAMLSRHELLTFNELPLAVKMRLTFAALSAPASFVRWVDHDHFEITPDGEAAYARRFGSRPTRVADAVLCLEPVKTADVVICLPGPDYWGQA